MTKTTNLEIYQKYLELVNYTNNLIRKYPKSETFTLVAEIKTTIYSGLKCLMYSIKVYNKQEKLKWLNEFDINLNLLKIHIRLSYNYKFISLKNYETWCKLITDICNMLGRWISSCVKK